MTVNTVASIHYRTGPAVVRWETGVPNQRKFDSIGDAIEFAMQFAEVQRSTLRIDFATGEAAFFPEIAELAARRRGARQQTKVVARYIAGNPEAQEFVEFWGTPRSELPE